MAEKSQHNARMSPERRRQEILDEAYRLCAGEGLSGLSFGRIAENLGITRGLVSHYFANREKIVEAMVDRHWSAFVTTVHADGSGSTRERLISLMAHYGDFLLGFPAEIRAFVYSAVGRALLDNATAEKLPVLIARIRECFAEPFTPMAEKTLWTMLPFVRSFIAVNCEEFTGAAARRALASYAADMILTGLEKAARLEAEKESENE